MKAKEKAEELIEKFYKQLTKDFEKNYYAQIIANKMWYNDAKQCALIAVDEILNFTISNCCEYQNRKYWEEVKKEIEKL